MNHAGKLAEWFGAHSPAMKLYTRQWLDSAGAEDVVHDVFVRLLAGRIEPREPKAWFFTAVRNAAISSARLGSRRRKRQYHASDGGFTLSSMIPEGDVSDEIRYEVTIK